MFTAKRGDFLRAGEDGESLHQQRIANTIVFIDGDSDNRAWFKAPGGTADADAALLAKAIKGVINAVTIMSPEGGVPGTTRVPFFVGWRLAPDPTDIFVARISAAPSGNLLKHHLAAGNVN